MYFYKLGTLAPSSSIMQLSRYSFWSVRFTSSASAISLACGGGRDGVRRWRPKEGGDFVDWRARRMNGVTRALRTVGVTGAPVQLTSDLTTLHVRSSTRSVLLTSSTSATAAIADECMLLFFKSRCCGRGKKATGKKATASCGRGEQTTASCVLGRVETEYTREWGPLQVKMPWARQEDDSVLCVLGRVEAAAYTSERGPRRRCPGTGRRWRRRVRRERAVRRARGWATHQDRSICFENLHQRECAVIHLVTAHAQLGNRGVLLQRRRDRLHRLVSE